MELVEIKQTINVFEDKIKELSNILKIDEAKNILKETEKKMFEDGFWDNNQEAKKIVDEVNFIKEKINKYQIIKDEIDELQEFLTFDDLSLFDDFELTKEKIEKELDNLETEALLSSKYDKCNCFLELHPGAGGTESQDWASMLFRMYKRFCERHNFKMSVLEYLDGDTAGIKSVTVKIEGKFAYGLLKSENGVHRLIRISPFDSNARRHTSFVGITVLPEMEEEMIEINPNELRIDTYRSSGAGGQYVNTTDSAVRITHLPTGIVVSCQNERSQIQNRLQCMKMLEAKLYAVQLEQNKDKLKDMANVKDNAFGSQIRTYTLQPYTLVKDHRTNFEMGSPDRVLDGDIDGFINSYLKYLVNKEG